jgi:phage terminase large subunit-like protein
LAQLALLASQHFNVEIGIGLSTDRWPGAEVLGTPDRRGTLTRPAPRCEVIVAGIDGGGLDDLFGLTLIGREKETKRWLVWTHSWCHVGVLDRRKSIAQILLDAKAVGELTIVDDELDDVSQMIDIVAQIKSAGLLGTVWVDPAGLGEFTDALAEIAVTVESKLLHGAAQGYGMMNALKTCERKLANGTLIHSKSGLMAWCVSNIKIEPTATAIRATKQNAGDAKIDPAMALFDAAQGMMLNPDPNRKVTVRSLLVV